LRHRAVVCYKHRGERCVSRTLGATRCAVSGGGGCVISVVKNGISGTAAPRMPHNHRGLSGKQRGVADDNNALALLLP